MRGKERLCIYGNWELGITPAYAGKRPLMFSQIPLKKDHPRLCGEKSTALVAGILSVGSPPPMRGKEFASYVNIFASGITPAYAGKRPFSTALTAFSRDHPRLCGEKYPPLELLCSGQGSPPPMRGKVTNITVARCYTRITPAYAGKRKAFRSRFSFSWDHPRLCGEKSPLWYNNRRGEGSPPPMRGKAADFTHVAFYHGITPAYAGKS